MQCGSSRRVIVVTCKMWIGLDGHIETPKCRYQDSAVDRIRLFSLGRREQAAETLMQCRFPAIPVGHATPSRDLLRDRMRLGVRVANLGKPMRQASIVSPVLACSPGQQVTCITHRRAAP